MKTMNLEQMECVSGGGWKAGAACGVLMAGWGAVLSYGAAAAAVTAGVSAGISLGWSLLAVGLCGAVSVNK